MIDFGQSSSDYLLIEKAIRYLDVNALLQPSLSDVAASVGMSEFHFQRLFSRWAGISPKRFLQFVTKENAKLLLARDSVLTAAHKTGLSSPSRLHDLFVQTEAVTPGEFKTRGTGVEIYYGFHPSPFGECLLASTHRGVCFLGFTDEQRHSALAMLAQTWPNAHLVEDTISTSAIVSHIFSPHPSIPLTVLLHGTNFQIKVWEALLALPVGSVASYQALASLAGLGSAYRSIGNALGRNPVAFLIPCHRILREVGGFGEYRYGSARKRAMLLFENALSHQPDE